MSMSGMILLIIKTRQGIRDIDPLCKTQEVEAPLVGMLQALVTVIVIRAVKNIKYLLQGYGLVHLLHVCQNVRNDA